MCSAVSSDLHTLLPEFIFSEIGVSDTSHSIKQLFKKLSVRLFLIFYSSLKKNVSMWTHETQYKVQLI